jgi:hypothetical protein
MAQQGEKMRVGAREGFAYHSMKLVLLASGNRYKVEFNTFFLINKAVQPFNVSPCPSSSLILTHILTVKAPNFPPHGNFPYFLGISVAPLGGFSHKNE